jgi:hypothetical protein
MKLIVLTGLVSIEKIQLAGELAQAFPHARVIDNVARLAMNSEALAQPIERIPGDILPELPALLAEVHETTILAVSEETHPHRLAEELEKVAALQPELEIITIALIDLRTSDCFPHLREAFEQAADLSLRLPYNLTEVLAHVD